MTFRIRPIAAALLACGLALSAGTLAAQPSAADLAPVGKTAASLYREGHERLERGDWSGAVTRFERLESELRSRGETGADGAMYWRAYAQSAAGRAREASATAERLIAEFPGSRWADEARVFTAGAGAGLAALEANGGDGDARGDRRADDAAEKDALAAIDALLATDNPKAVPVLERVLASNHGDRVKVRALFVLVQLDAAAGSRALDAILTGNGSTHLKREAVKMLAVGGERETLDRLEPLYAGADLATRRAVLEAWMIGERIDLLARVVGTEPDRGLRRQAIHLIGAAGDGATLETLYASLTDPGDRGEVLTAFGVANDGARLARIARAERDPAVQRRALESLGIVGGTEARTTIREIYAASTDKGVKRAAINGLIIAKDGEGLVALYRGESDADFKRELMRALSVVDDDAAIELIDRALGEGQ